MDKSSEDKKTQGIQSDTDKTDQETQSPKPAIDKQDIENAPTFEQGWEEQRKYGAD